MGRIYYNLLQDYSKIILTNFFLEISFLKKTEGYKLCIV